MRQSISGYEGQNTQTNKQCLIEWMVEQKTHKPEIGELNPTKMLVAEKWFQKPLKSPGFPKRGEGRGANPGGGSAKLLFGKYFANKKAFQ